MLLDLQLNSACVSCRYLVTCSIFSEILFSLCHFLLFIIFCALLHHLLLLASSSIIHFQCHRVARVFAFTLSHSALQWFLLQIHLLSIRTVVNKLTFFWWQNFSVKVLLFILEVGVVYRRETMQEYGSFQAVIRKHF